MCKKILKNLIVIYIIFLAFNLKTYATSVESGEEKEECTHTVYSDSDTSTYHYGYCDVCGECDSRTSHYVYRYKNTGDEDTHSGYCSCGKYMGEYWHSYNTFTQYDKNNHIGECSCGYSTYLSHVDSYVSITKGEVIEGVSYNTDEQLDNNHKVICRDCDEFLRVENHKWSGGDVSPHKCSKCSYVHSKQYDATKGRHYFNLTSISSIGSIAKCQVCTEYLTLEYEKGCLLPKLPPKEKYTMIGNPKPMQEKSVDDDQYIKTNFMPINEAGEIIPLNEGSLILRSYRQGNYYTHYSKLTVKAIEKIAENLKYSKNKELLNYITKKLKSLGTLGGYNQGKKEDIIEEIINTVSGDKDLEVVDAESIINVVSKMGDFAIKAIKTPLLEWFKEDLEIKDTWLSGGQTTLEHEYFGDWYSSKDRKYTLYFSKLTPGKYEILHSKLLTEEVEFDIYSYTAEGFTELLYCTLFNKGDDSASKDEPCDILAYVNVGYRDVNGNTIYNKNGELATPPDSVISNIVYSGTSERTVVSNIVADMKWTQSAGYRYKGYLIRYGDDKSGYYGLYNSPSEMTITTNSSVSVTSSFTTQGLGISVVFYYEPVEILSVKHYVDGKLIDTNKNLNQITMPSVTEYDVYEEVYAPKKFASLNKNFWPGYILTGYSIYKDSISENNLIARKEYDVNTTTKMNSKDDAKRYVEIHTAMIEETLTECKLKRAEQLGYGANKILVFEYMFPKVEIKNLDYNSNALLKDVNRQQLTYEFRLEGDNMLVKSLDTTEVKNGKYKELKIKTVNGTIKNFKYDASDYSLVQAWIYTKDLNKNTKTLYKVIVGNEALIPAGISNEKVEVTNDMFSFADGYILNTEELLAVMNKVWADLYIEFKYYYGANVVNVSYIDEENNVLMPPERYKMVANLKEIDVPAIELDGYKLFEYKLDDIENKNVKNLKKVTISDNGHDRDLIFVYTKDIDKPDIPLDKPNYPYAVIKSNDKNNEEYIVETAIPTSEDLYANVVTDSYIIENVLSLIEEKQKVNVTLKKQYYTTSDDDENKITSNIAVASAKQSIEFDLSFSYYGGENHKLFIIDNAIIENEAVIDKNHYTKNGKVLLDADYGDNEPTVRFEKGGKLQIQNNSQCYFIEERNGIFYIEIMLDGIDYTKPDMDAFVQNYQSDYIAIERMIRESAVVNGDYLSVVAEGEEIIYLDGLNKMMSAERIPNVVELISAKYYKNTAKAPLTNSSVLYEDRNIFTYEKAKNELYPTTLATINYKEIVSGEETRIKTFTPIDIKMNDINIYTPIVNTAELIPLNEEGRSDNQLVLDNKENVLTLDSVFTIRIPHSGEHYYAVKDYVPYKGYGTKDYNYKGNYLYDEVLYGPKKLETIAFANQKLVKFSFDVYAVRYEEGKIKDKKLILADKWFDLGELGIESMSIEDYKFIIPVWVNDNVDGKISIRIVAENIPEEFETTTNDIFEYISYESANSKGAYILQKDFNVFIVGSIYDLQIRDSDDFGWSGRLISALKILNSSDTKNLFLPIGQNNQNIFSGYKYGLKLGYRFYFDLKTKGIASDQISITPEYYYVSKDGGQATADISIFYDTLSEKYLKLSNQNDVDISLVLTNTRGNVNNSNFIFELVRGKIRDENKVYKVAVNIGKVFAGLILDEVNVKLPYDNILELAKLYGYGSDTDKFIYEAKKSKNVENEDSIRNCNGHWYGEYYLPSTTKIALGKDITREDIIKDESKIIEEGYLIVVFKDIVTLDNNLEYLSYSNPANDMRWEKEGAEYNFYEVNLPNGNMVTIKDMEAGIAMAIYDIGLRANDDYSSEGTH